MRSAVFLVLCLAATVGWSAEFTRVIPVDCRQVVLVFTPDWPSSMGTLQCLERAGTNDAWQHVGAPAPVLLGRRGLAWGLGLHANTPEGAPRKKEGDQCSPAGVFAFGTAFGRIPIEDVRWLRLPYRSLAPTTEAVDDPTSRFYNCIVDRARIPQPDWRSSEHMWTIPVYELGAIIDHNPDRRPSAGSCIFLHLWPEGVSGTAGCTALHRADLLAVLRWLDPAKQPVLVQLPEKIARKRLPELYDHR